MVEEFVENKLIVYVLSAFEFCKFNGLLNFEILGKKNIFKMADFLPPQKVFCELIDNNRSYFANY